MSDNLYQRNGIWWARIKVRGRDHRRSLRTGSKVEAKKRLTKFLADVEHARFYGTSRKSWKAAVIEWNAQASGVKASTVTRYLVSLDAVSAKLRELYLDEVNTHEKIAEVAAWRRKQGVTNATVRRDLTAVSIVLATCLPPGTVNAARSFDRSTMKERRDPIVLPEASDIDAVCGRAPGNLAKLFRFLQFTGMRMEEAADLPRRLVKAHGAELYNTKRNRVRIVTLDERAKGTVEGTVPYAKKDGPLFWHGEGERYASVSSRFRNIVLELSAKGLITRRFRLHDLRHWYAVDALRARRMNLYDLQQQLGHRSIKTTEIYLDYLTPEEQRWAKYGAQNAAQQ